jgi:hypothetical protein
MQTDRDAVRQAILDYVESFYEAAPARAERSVARDLAKFGLRRAEDGTFERRDMNFDQLVASATRGIAGGAKEIEIFDLRERIACARLTAVWGTDFIHLAKIDGRWTIHHVIWQSAAA